MIAGAGASHVEEVALGGDHFIEVAVVGDGLDPLGVGVGLP